MTRATLNPVVACIGERKMRRGRALLFSRTTRRQAHETATYATARHSCSLMILLASDHCRRDFTTPPGRLGVQHFVSLSDGGDQ